MQAGADHGPPENHNGGQGERTVDSSITKTNTLIAQAVDGSPDALSSLLEEFGPLVRREIGPRIPAQWRSVLSEDDVMQQTYADAFRSIGQFVPLGDGSFRAWLASLATFNLRDALRMLTAEKRGGDRKRVGNNPSSDSYDDLLDILSDSGTSPSGRVARNEGASALEDAISSLPEIYQAVVRLFDLECRPIGVVADNIQRSPGAVYMLRARAHDKLRRVLGETGKFFTDSP